jgi:uncharacterized protein (DUF169 family)
MNHASLAGQLQNLLSLRAAPVAVAFLDRPPAGVARVEAAAASGCSYWRLAAEGRTFYTEAADHHNCPIGSYTHGIDLPPERAHELTDVLGTMFDLGYLRPEEVAGVPRREQKFQVAVYAPLAEATFEPEVVLVCGNSRQMMLLTEAAQAAGVPSGSGLMGRPTCAAIPHAARAQACVASLGCIGNRVYTGLKDDEFYLVFPGARLAPIVEKLATLVNANRQLESYHLMRKSTIHSRR